MSSIKGKVIAIVAALAIGASAAIAAPAASAGKDKDSLYMMNKVRKELVTIPYYGVFDNLAYKIDGSTVTLYGQVVRPSTRSSAEKRVKKIEGVERVINNIEVLPLSTFDDSIRARAYRAIFRSGSLYRYAMGVNPSIHIIVNRGHVTLEGVVSNKMDSQLAYFAANSVPGVFSVRNNLRVERSS
ncbi:MAG TPA: BON domain-containing protein [Blastocatellia bacterium]|nr:BON domain-containing protein [Blastocatellia bacterium]